MVVVGDDVVAVCSDAVAVRMMLCCFASSLCSSFDSGSSLRPVGREFAWLISLPVSAHLSLSPSMNEVVSAAGMVCGGVGVVYPQ